MPTKTMTLMQSATMRALVVLLIVLAEIHGQLVESFSSALDLPIDKQITLEFRADVYQTLKYRRQSPRAVLIITACSVPIEWNLFRQNVANESTGTSLLLHSSITNDQEVYKLPAFKQSQGVDVYTIKLKTNRDTYGHAFLATQSVGPLTKSGGIGKVLVQPGKLKNREVLLRWPKRTHLNASLYCLVLSTDRNYSILCGALSLDTYKQIRNLVQPILGNPMVYCTSNQSIRMNLGDLPKSKDNELLINLFAINRTTGFTFLHARNSTNLQNFRAPMTLKENKLTTISLKQTTTLKVQANRKSFVNQILDIYIVPCTGSINIELFHKGELMETRQNVDAFAKVSVPNVLKKNYLLKLHGKQKNAKASSVQIFATTLSALFNPFPEMPKRPSVKEYKVLRTCNSATVGWIPPKDLKMAYYCVIVRQGKSELYEAMANQCAIQKMLKSATNYVSKSCKQMKHTARIGVLTQEINHLKPGTVYTVQIIVRKPKARMLAYEMLQIRTKAQCK